MRPTHADSEWLINGRNQGTPFPWICERSGKQFSEGGDGVIRDPHTNLGRKCSETKLPLEDTIAMSFSNWRRFVLGEMDVICSR